MRNVGAPRNPKKYCRFHRNRSHDTEDCFQLQDEIEALIRRGVLNRFVKNRREERRPAEDTVPLEDPNDNRPIAGTINVIKGGSSAEESAEEKTSLKRPRTSEAISFSDEDLGEVKTPHDDAVVISMVVNKFHVKRVLVDNGSLANVLYYHVYQKIGLVESQLRKINTPLVGFIGDSVPVAGEVSLLVTVGLAPRESTVRMDFLVVRLLAVYNVILGRPRLNALQAVVSTYHLLVRFPTAEGIGEARGDQMMAKQCYIATCKAKQRTEASSQQELLTEASTQAIDRTLPIEILDVRDNPWEKRVEPGELLTQVSLLKNFPKLTVQVGSDLSPRERERLTEFLRANIDVFAWSPADMPGIDPRIMTHRLQVKLTCRPVRQKKRSSALERQQATAQEVDKLLEAGFIREIRMAPKDEEKTAFITDKGTYCYKVMPFGLKNTGATYQRLVS
ncbi:uncharacterized protein LOC120112949 [Phoenix dactylifera]|uniref:Uncharacterized protein LOC120112949 n=1 Tax=Phoenix dactylifera TaxID=42345 RepID=A0A8B9AU49_PHODC|nr:uncharacterized protein LOC120112949 [Phoenix dactylifera]